MSIFILRRWTVVSVMVSGLLLSTVHGETLNCSDNHLAQRAQQLGVNPALVKRIVAESVVTLDIDIGGSARRGCSGVVFEDNQHILTNLHCTIQAQRITVKPHVGVHSYNVVQVVSHGYFHDVALLKLAGPIPSAQPVTFKQHSTQAPKVMALPGCGIELTNPKAGHGIGTIRRKGSLALGPASLVISAGLNLQPMMSGALIIDSTGYPVALASSKAGVALHSYRTTSYKPPVIYEEVYAIQGARIAGLLQPIHPTISAVTRWSDGLGESKSGNLFGSMLGDARALTSLRQTYLDEDDECDFKGQMGFWLSHRGKQLPPGLLADLHHGLSDLHDGQHPVDPIISYQYASSLLNSGAEDEAIAILEDVVRFQNEHNVALTLLALLYRERKDEYNLNRMVEVFQSIVPQIEEESRLNNF